MSALYIGRYGSTCSSTMWTRKRSIRTQREPTQFRFPVCFLWSSSPVNFTFSYYLCLSLIRKPLLRFFFHLRNVALLILDSVLSRRYLPWAACCHQLPELRSLSRVGAALWFLFPKRLSPE